MKGDDMAKQYTVMNGKEVVYGPTSNYNELKVYLSGLTPAVKAKCSVAITDDKKPVQPQAETVVETTDKPEVKKNVAQQQPVQQSEHQQPKPPSDFDKVFTNYLEGGGVTELWKPKDGRNLIRFLPIGGVLPSDWKTPFPFLMTGVHPNVGLSLNEIVYCPRLTHGAACPICNFSWNMYNSTDNNDKMISKRIRAYKRILANIIDLSDVQAGVQKFGFGKKLAEKILTYKQDSEYLIDGKDFLDPESGRNFVLIKKTVDNFPNYDDSRPEIKVTPLSQLYPRWKAECHDLTKDMQAKSYDEMVKILEETKKAILTTDPSAWGKVGSGQPSAKRVQQQQPDNDLGVQIIEENADDVLNRLNNL